MIIINSLAHLQEYGIEMLTGEACNLGARILCKVTASGADLIEEATGLQIVRTDGVNGGVANLYLHPNDIFTLGITALFIQGCTEVWLKDDSNTSLIGFNLNLPEDREQREAMLVDCEYDGVVYQSPPKDILRVYRSHSTHPHIGTKNIHSM